METDILDLVHTAKKKKPLKYNYKHRDNRNVILGAHSKKNNL